ncbi:MlaD family protein [Pelagibius sp. Alg239-R121]|uniref:MlaD family protein n=1 Tax=Pelagibius sp. Alg239-R121 TaxID=2993448 RepID=UPI0024A77FBE|nr:MlaD family protein [Pelagibius sp. Alg239-R121]
METRANYVMVGSFVLLLVFGLLGFVVWLAKFQVDTELKRFDIFFRGSVTGLAVGSPVRYSGVRVGEVVFIGLDHDDPNRVRALVEVDAKTPVKTDTYATLNLAGLTGGLYVLLSGGSREAPLLEMAEDQKRPVIPSRSSDLESVISSAPELLDGAILLLNRANDVLNDNNRADIAATLANLREVSEAFIENREKVENLINDASLTMNNLSNATGSLKETANSIKVNLDRLTESADRTLLAFESTAGTIDGSVEGVSTDLRVLLKSLDSTATSLDGAASQMEKLIAENREPINDFTTTGLYELSNVLIEARDLISDLQRITTEVQRDPARFIFGDQQQGYDAQ